MSASQTMTRTDSSMTAPSCRNIISAHQAANGSTIASTREVPAGIRTTPFFSDRSSTTPSPIHIAVATATAAGPTAATAAGAVANSANWASPSASATSSDVRKVHPESRSHSACASEKPRVSRPANASGDQASADSSAATRTRAVMTRCFSTRRSSGRVGNRRFGLDLFAGHAEATLPPGVPAQRGLELRSIEVRPEHVAEIKLRIGQLPKQEVADAALATGAYQKIRLGRERQRKPLRNRALVDAHVARTRSELFFRGTLSSLGNVPAPAIVGAYRQVQACVVRGPLLRLRDKSPQIGIEREGLADDAHAHAEFHQLVHFPLQRDHEQPHQRGDLVGRPPPVLRAERKECQ